MKMCKGCEFLKIEKPDGLNEGYARCTKHEVSTILIGRNYMQKVKRLECYEEQLKREGEKNVRKSD